MCVWGFDFTVLQKKKIRFRKNAIFLTKSNNFDHAEKIVGCFLEI